MLARFHHILAIAFPVLAIVTFIVCVVMGTWSCTAFPDSGRAVHTGYAVVGPLVLVTLFAGAITAPGGTKGFALWGGMMLLAGLTLALLLFVPKILFLNGRLYQALDAVNLRDIAEGLLKYESKHGCFPPVAIRDREGKALLSWRVTLLPYLGEEELYRQFHLDEPWDSPHNLRLLERMPNVYKRPKLYRRDVPEPSITVTYYQVFVGKGAVFEEDWSASLQDVTDDLSKTILIGENSVAVPWTKPEDIRFNPTSPLPRSGSGLGFLIQMGLCDGSTRGVLADDREGFPSEADPLRVLITRNAGDWTERLH